MLLDPVPFDSVKQYAIYEVISYALCMMHDQSETMLLTKEQ